MEPPSLLKTRKKQRGRPFTPGQSGNPKGRPKGALSKVTLEARAACAAIVDDPDYRQKLTARAKAGTLPPGIEVMLWHYAKGKPPDHVSVDLPPGSAMSLDIDVEMVKGLSDAELEAGQAFLRKLLGTDA